MPKFGKKSVNQKRGFSAYGKLFNFSRSKNKTPKKDKSEVQINIKKKKRFSFHILNKKAKDEFKSVSGNIEIKGVGKSFGKNIVLKNVNLIIPKGKIFGIIGVSGSGKTTLLRSIVGFYKPSEGVILYNKVDIRKQREIITRNFGFATQDNSFYDNLRVDENIRFFGKLYGLKGNILEERIDNVLSLVELSDAKKRLARNLSSGMRRRLDLACALIHNPSTLILDEPTEDLDPHLRQELLEVIKKINKDGTTVIFTTHLINEAEYLCDIVAIISNNTILKVGSTSDLRKVYKGGEEIHLVLEDTGRYGFYIKKLKKYSMHIRNGKLIIHIKNTEKAIKVLKTLLGWIERNKDKIILADIRRPSLEEVFQELTKNVKKSKKR